MSVSLSQSHRFDEFELDPARRTLERDGRLVPLSPKAFDVLSYLVQNPARAITKDELLKAVWPGSFVEEGNLAQHISSLRKAFGDRAGLIVTIPGRGYQFTARVQSPQAAEATAEVPAGEGEGPFIAGDGASVGGVDIVVQRVLERTHVLIEETSTMPRRAAFPSWAVWSLAAMLPVAVCVVYAIRRLSPPPKLQRVMIADFLNTTGDPQFDQSLNTALAAGLGQSPYIQLMSKGDVHSTLKRMEKALDTPLLGDTALEVCQRAGFQALLRGRIASDGLGYQLAMDEVNCANGAVVATTRGKAASKDSVLNTLDSLANSARRKLGETSQSIAAYDVPMGEATTFSFEALQDYTKGAELGNAGKVAEALPLFRKAVQLDTKFAMAIAAVGTVYYILQDREQAGLYYKQAFDLSGNLSESEKLSIRSRYYQLFVRDLTAARAIYEEQTRVYPADHTGWAALADMDTQAGDYPAAIAAGEQALRIANPRQEVDYNVLALAYKRGGRFAEAKRTIAAAQAQNLDAAALHYLLLDIAIVEQDRQTIEREIAWSRDHSALSQSLDYEAIYEADQGHFAKSEELFRSAIEQSVKDVDLNLAHSMLTDEAGIELQAGRVEEARELLKKVPTDTEGKLQFKSANFAVFAARAGDIAVASDYLGLPMMYPHETVALTLYRPEMNALLALHRHDPAAAIAALEVSRPYELAHCEVNEIRGDAYLALKDGAHAQAEFQKLIDHPALEEPTLPRTFIAHVGLARALALQHKTDDSKAEYERFFSLWRDADANIPILQEARAEYAKL